MPRPIFPARVFSLALAAAVLAPPAARAETPEILRVCLADRTSPGCADWLTRIFVCERATALSGCAELLVARDAALAPPERPAEESVPEPAEETAEMPPSACPVLASSDWRAIVRPDPAGGDRLQLVVEGRITLPTPGWRVAIEAGSADRSANPIQQVVVTAAPPDPAISVLQVLTDYDLRLEAPALGIARPGASPLRGVRISCAGVELADIGEVPRID